MSGLAAERFQSGRFRLGFDFLRAPTFLASRSLRARSRFTLMGQMLAISPLYSFLRLLPNLGPDAPSVADKSISNEALQGLRIAYINGVICIAGRRYQLIYEISGENGRRKKNPARLL
jgi:hypothetical protein